jgi:hypothetical protein
MAFPSDQIIEMAFNNDIDESNYAQTGYTEITKWVDAISSENLRGRDHEIGRTEAGVLSVTLDNTDRRFSAANTRSPYHPNVKPGRRFRWRGNNMSHPNVARSGGRDGSLVGFSEYTYSAYDYAALGISVPVYVAHSPASLPALPSDITSHAEITIASGQATGNRHLLEWYIPLEYGVRLTHSAYIWKVSGTENAAVTGSLAIEYYDSDGVIMADTTSAAWSTATPTTPTRRALAHTPPGTAKYAKAVLNLNPGATTTTALVYGLAAVQSELPANLTPDISGWVDTYNWVVRGTGAISRLDTTDASIQSLVVTWATGDAGLEIRIPHLIPGEVYTATVQTYKSAGANIQLAADGDGALGTVLSANTTWTTLTTTWTAQTSEQSLQWLPVTAVTAGHTMRVRKLNVLKASSAALETAANATGETTWARPMDIFEGWTESFPSRLSQSQTTITVVDRMKRLGDVIIGNVLPETLAQDGAELIIPFNDLPADAQGSVSQIGSWGADGAFTTIPIGRTRGDLGTSTYELGVEGPTGDTALLLTPGGDSQGFLIPIPYSPDYETDPPPPPPPPGPLPGTQTYTRTYDATWSRSYNGSNTPRYDDPNVLYHGTGPGGSNGNQKAMIGFNYPAIMADLAGATVKSVSLIMRNLHSYWYNGMNTWVGNHTNAAKPATYDVGTTWQGRWYFRWGYQHTLAVDLGVQLGYDFAGGSTKGIVIGPCLSGDCSDDGYGYFAGAGYTTNGHSGPYLLITYTK